MIYIYLGSYLKIVYFIGNFSSVHPAFILLIFTYRKISIFLKSLLMYKIFILVSIIPSYYCFCLYLPSYLLV